MAASTAPAADRATSKKKAGRHRNIDAGLLNGFSKDQNTVVQFSSVAAGRSHVS